MHKDSDRRDNDANSTSRRKILTATTLGAVSMAASSLFGKSPAASQTSAKPDRQALQNQELKGKTAFITGGARGVIKTTQAAVGFMKPQGSGRIIYISSALGRMGNELFPIYTSTKWAVIGFAKSAALSYGKFNILCNTIAPGLANTPLADNDFMLRKLLPDKPNPTFAMLSEQLKPGNPIAVGHVEPVDVAKAVLFFSGSATRRVTGEVFDVSYGSLARSIA
jgi:hypothetical protein